MATRRIRATWKAWRRREKRMSPGNEGKRLDGRLAWFYSEVCGRNSDN
jgi:hypothetical protein